MFVTFKSRNRNVSIGPCSETQECLIVVLLGSSVEDLIIQDEPLEGICVKAEWWLSKN